MMSMLVVKIFNRHLGDMKFQFGETIVQIKPIHVCPILGPRVPPITNEFLFVDPEHMMNFRMKQFPKKKKTYGLKEIDDTLKQEKTGHQEIVSNHVSLRRMRLENLLQQVTPGEGLEVVKDLMVDDDVEVNLEVISSEYGGGLLKWKKGDEKDNNDKNDVEENVKSEEEQPQVAEEENSEPPTVMVYFNGKKDTMVVAEVAKTEILFFNQEEVVGKACKASADQTTVVSVEE
ncbi:hypothetical protein GIB67_027252 [Kingdonia uniflora]|uniref:Uncharacterized protein n=1 Tax=Kingdonia uniflora TaxID=39325 RepID=A0A7J7KYG6_9MAGN|nr:hypothetical protein GIB67_027252 [Kingdonia uniflora]